ncbi:GNAT family N-acetyltransferase [Leifsonia poae]|uniref:GNAT family N-acetyltransferase n=1 Tax=Leifsonia poae TaxID=110933 RepID=UPI003D688AF8
MHSARLPSSDGYRTGLRRSPGADRGALVRFLSENVFPFHVIPRPTAEDANRAIEAGHYDGREHATLWARDPDGTIIGVVRLDDLDDDTPMVDLRLAEAQRGRGLGAKVLAAATDYVFSTMPITNRFEGQTREDNVAMRRTFLRCGWVKEAHYRDGWPIEGQAPLASVAYSVLRRDWESGTSTPVNWDDDPEVAALSR